MLRVYDIIFASREEIEFMNKGAHNEIKLL